MGFYDFRCAVTHVSLRGGDAVLVALEPTDGGYRPISLGIRGHYNGFGSIYEIEECLNTELVFAYFLARIRDGQLALDPDYKRDFGNPPRDIENLLRYFERNISDATDENPAAALSGCRIVFALVARPVWDAVAAAAAPAEGTAESWFKQAFEHAPVAEGIYHAHIPELAPELRALNAMNAFIAMRGISWAPEEDDEIGTVHMAEEMRELLDHARRDFNDVPAVLTALDEYAAKVDDLLNEES